MKKILLFLLLGSAMLGTAQARITVQLMNKQELINTVGTLGKMVFEEDKILIYDVDDNLITETDLTENLSIEVDTETSTITVSSGEGQEDVFDITMGIEDLRIHNIPMGSTIRVYTMNGILLQQVVTTGESEIIPMQNMPSGTYILLINNTCLKILKP